MGERELSSWEQTALDLANYEPPRVERILTSAELEREVLYAGRDNVSDPI